MINFFQDYKAEEPQEAQESEYAFSALNKNGIAPATTVKNVDDELLVKDLK